MTATCIPPYEEWSAVLATNGASIEAVRSRVGPHVVDEVRTEVLGAAFQYTRTLRQIAHGVGISLPDPLHAEVHAGTPVIMTGHQPVIYHPGLLEKTGRARQLALSTNALVVNVSIDTDTGEGGHLVWPLARKDELALKYGTISTNATLFLEQRIKDVVDVSRVFEEAERDLITSGLEDVARRLEDVSRLYQALAQESVVAANAIVRMALAGAGHLEVPLSRIVELPSVRRFFREIASNSREFASAYNATLDEYRRVHKIKNPANPFPNMVIEDDQVELPLWLVSGDSRSPLRARDCEPQSSLEGGVIAPRGSIVTLLLRGLCSDLFVHGLGGGRYDQFVDAFASAYWGVALPRFVVASATRYLFPSRLERYQRARELRTRYKEIVSHTEKFLGVGIFTPEEDIALRERVIRRAHLLAELRGASTPDARSRVAHSLNEVNRSIRELVDGSSLAQTLKEGEIDDVTLARWAYREYPFFFFQDGLNTP